MTFRAKIGRVNRITNRGMYPDELGVVNAYSIFIPTHHAGPVYSLLCYNLTPAVLSCFAMCTIYSSITHHAGPVLQSFMYVLDLLSLRPIYFIIYWFASFLLCLSFLL